MTTSVENDDGDWVPAIPMPLMLWPSRYICSCRRRYWSMEGYRGHYALRHILKI